MRNTVKAAGRVEHVILGEQLMRLREKAGLTQRGLEARLGRTHGFVAKVELGKQHIDIASLMDWIEAVGGDEVQLIIDFRDELRKHKPK